MAILNLNPEDEVYYAQKFKVVEPKQLPLIGDEKDGYAVTKIEGNIDVELEHPSDEAYGYRFISVEYTEKDTHDPATYYEFYAVRKDKEFHLIYKIFEDTVEVGRDDFLNDSFTVAGNEHWGEMKWEGDDKDEALEIFDELEPSAEADGDGFKVKGYFLIEEDECECVFTVLKESDYSKIIDDVK